MKRRRAHGSADVRRKQKMSTKLDQQPERLSCPTPHKAVYPGRKEAKSALKKLLGSGNANAPRYHAYRCRCGRFHVGSVPVSDRTLARIRGQE